MGMCVVPVRGEESQLFFLKSRSLPGSVTKSNVVQGTLQRYSVFSLNLLSHGSKCCASQSCEQRLRVGTEWELVLVV